MKGAGDVHTHSNDHRHGDWPAGGGVAGATGDGGTGHVRQGAIRSQITWTAPNHTGLYKLRATTSGGADYLPATSNVVK
jgi:hypothetical protein